MRDVILFVVMHFDLIHVQLLKRKNISDDNEVASSNQTNSTIYAEVDKSPLKTPVSTKGGRVYTKSKGYKGNKAAVQTPISAAGKSSFIPRDH